MTPRNHRRMAAETLAEAFIERDRLRALVAENDRQVAASLREWADVNGLSYATEAHARNTLLSVGLLPAPAVRLIAENDLPADTPPRDKALAAMGRGL